VAAGVLAEAEDHEGIRFPGQAGRPFVGLLKEVECRADQGVNRLDIVDDNVEHAEDGDARTGQCPDAIPKIRFFAALSLLLAVMQVMGSSGIAKVGRGT
jgi:hypothetical protein